MGIEDIMLDLQDGVISFKDARRLADEACHCEDELEEMIEKVDDLERERSEGEEWTEYISACHQYE